MAVWTDGVSDIVIRQNGLALYASGSFEDFIPVGAVAAKKGENPPRCLDPEILAVSADADIALAGRAGGKLAVVSLRGAFEVYELPIFGALAAVGLPKGEFIYACVRQSSSKEKLDLKKIEIRRIRILPSGAYEELEAPGVPEPTKCSFDPDVVAEYGFGTKEKAFGGYEFRLAVTPFGVVASDSWNGLIALMPQGEKNFSFTLRLPMKDLDQAQIFGIAVPNGMIISFNPYPDYCYLIRCNSDGDVMYHGGGWNESSDLVVVDDDDDDDDPYRDDEEVEWRNFLPPVLLNEEEFFIANSSGDHILLFSFSDRSYYAEGRKCEADNICAAAGAADRLVLRSEGGSTVYTLARDENWEVVKLPKLTKKDLANQGSRKVPPEVKVTLANSLAGGWIASAFKEISIPFRIINRGGKGRAISVYVDGDAVERGLVSPVWAEVDGALFELLPISPGRYRGELEDFDLEPARHVPGEEIQVSETKMKIKVETVTSGQGKIHVRLGFTERNNTNLSTGCDAKVTVR